MENIVDQKTQDHVGRAIKHHEPGIVATVKCYNEKWDEMLHMQLAANAPANAIMPLELNTKGIFNLDVDADIWIDAGSDDFKQFPNNQPPGWLVDPNVQKQICDAQEYINSQQELECCNAECYNLQTWITEQDAAVQHAKQLCCGGMPNSENDYT